MHPRHPLVRLTATMIASRLAAGSPPAQARANDGGTARTAANAPMACPGPSNRRGIASAAMLTAAV